MHTHTPCLMMGEVSLETSQKNIMIQDMINSDNSMIKTVYKLGTKGFPKKKTPDI